MQNGDNTRNLVLTDYQHLKLKILFPNFRKFDSVTKALQAQNSAKAITWYIFDYVILYFPSMSHRLSVSAQIVHSFDFEKDICKIQKGNTNFRTYFKKEAVEKFKIERARMNNENVDDSIVEQACKRQKSIVLDNIAGYMDINIL